MTRISIAVAGLAIALAPACGKKHEEDKSGKSGGETAHAGPKAGPGVDLAGKKVAIGTLNDESGPAAALGKPFANGKRLLAKVINAGDAGLLPEGWTIELVERDTAYNPQNASKEFKAIKDQVLFFGTSFGTVTTLPLQKPLQRDGAVAFPASLSSSMANHESTPPLGPSYLVEAMRAMDFAVAAAGGADKVKAGVLYQNDDYGKDGLAGFKTAAEKHGVTIVAAHPVEATDKDFTASIKDLKDKGANYVLLATLPTATGPVLGNAAASKYMPTWMGLTPSWVDAFFAHPNLPAPVFTNFHWVMGLPYWGEDLPGMDVFLKAWGEHGADMGNPDFYILASYVQGLVQTEILRRTIEAGDVTREAFTAQLKTVKDWDAGGLIQKIDLSTFPYQTSVRTRVLRPDFEKKTWAVAEHGAFAEPQALDAGGEGAAPAAAKGVEAGASGGN